jgi:hypothetical protein
MRPSAHLTENAWEEDAMTQPKVVARAEWEAARTELHPACATATPTNDSLSTFVAGAISA